MTQKDMNDIIISNAALCRWYEFLESVAKSMGLKNSHQFPDDDIVEDDGEYYLSVTISNKQYQMLLNDDEVSLH